MSLDPNACGDRVGSHLARIRGKCALQIKQDDSRPVRICHKLGREVATPEEFRKMMGIA